MLPRFRSCTSSRGTVLSRAVLEQEQYSQGLSRAAGLVSSSLRMSQQKMLSAICASKKKTPAV